VVKGDKNREQVWISMEYDVAELAPGDGGATVAARCARAHDGGRRPALNASTKQELYATPTST